MLKVLSMESRVFLGLFPLLEILFPFSPTPLVLHNVPLIIRRSLVFSGKR